MLLMSSFTVVPCLSAEANFKGVNMSGVNFYGANLTGVNIIEVTHVKSQSLVPLPPFVAVHACPATP